MNLKLLTKLVKLANNNPNENEANLAARKVCKIIEESQFKFVPDEDLTRGGHNAPQYATHVYSSPPSPSYDWIVDYIKRATVSPDYETFKQGSWSNPFETPQWNTSPNKDDEKYYTRRKERGFGDTKRNLTCSKCNQKKETIFIGLEEVFVCNECRWNAFREKF